MRLTEKSKEYILNQYPKEAVIFIKGKKQIPILNSHPNPNHQFKICSKQYLKICPDIIIHSHTHHVDKTKDPRTPSIQDERLQITTNIPHGIVYTNGDFVTEVLFYECKDN